MSWKAPDRPSVGTPHAPIEGIGQDTSRSRMSGMSGAMGAKHTWVIFRRKPFMSRPRQGLNRGSVSTKDDDQPTGERINMKLNCKRERLLPVTWREPEAGNGRGAASVARARSEREPCCPFAPALGPHHGSQRGDCADQRQHNEARHQKEATLEVMHGKRHHDHHLLLS